MPKAVVAAGYADVDIIKTLETFPTRHGLVNVQKITRGARPAIAPWIWPGFPRKPGFAPWPPWAGTNMGPIWKTASASSPISIFLC